MMAWYNMNRETQGKEHRVYIANQENLAAFAERAMHSSVLAIDTEFLREKTYYAKLCLIQLATDDETAIVDSQLEYAADDVVYLPRMYERMRAQLVELGRLSWLDRDFEDLADPARYAANERERYKRLKRVSQLSRRQLSAAREVAAWRELEAQRRDVPRKWVVTDEQIVEACKREPRSIDDLFMVRGLSDRLSTKDARTVVSLIASALDASPDTWPEPDRCGKNEPNVDAELDLMCALVRLRAKQNGVAFPTLASHDDLARVARGYREGVDLLRGWRRALVGEELLELLEGRLALSIDGSELRVEHRS